MEFQSIIVDRKWLKPTGLASIILFKVDDNYESYLIKVMGTPINL